MVKSPKTEQKKNSMDIVDIEKLYALHKAGLSLNELSIRYNLPYVSLHRAVKAYEKEINKVK